MKIEGTNIILNGYKFFKPLETNPTDYPFLEVVLILDNNKIYPQLCITHTTAEEDYDYNYEDELEYTGIITNTDYFPIFKNPFSGDDIEFVVTSEKDITEEYNNITKEIEELESKRKSISRTKEIFILQKRLNEMISGIPPIFQKDNRLVSEPYNENESMTSENVILGEEY